MRWGKCRALLASVLTLVLFVPQAHAWHAVGHMAVAYIAWQKLTPHTRTRVTALLRKNPYYAKWTAYIPKGTKAADRNLYLFMMAATWPDEIKALSSGHHGNDTPPHDVQQAEANLGYADKDMRKYWHFVDEPFSNDGTPLPLVPEANAASMVAVLRTTLHKKAAASTDPLKSYDLVWLEHLVGDLHQPLHCTMRMTQAGPAGDRGGNAVDLTVGSDLHTFWDEVPGSGDTSDFLKAAAYAKSLPAAPADLAAKTDETAWVAESFALAKANVYVDPPIGPALGPYTLTDAYRTQAAQVARQQIALAGARLAKVLNAELR